MLERIQTSDDIRVCYAFGVCCNHIMPYYSMYLPITQYADMFNNPFGYQRTYPYQLVRHKDHNICNIELLLA